MLTSFIIKILFIVKAEFLIAYHKRHKSMILLLESLKFTRDEQQRKAVCLKKEWNIRDNYANATPVRRGRLLLELKCRS